jgi:hypothetical protein
MPLEKDNKADHEAAAEETVYRPQPRTCLMCRSTFDSAWAGERICKSCKTHKRWRDGAAIMPR